jgi:hypothetical protein
LVAVECSNRRKIVYIYERIEKSVSRLRGVTNSRTFLRSHQETGSAYGTSGRRDLCRDGVPHERTAAYRLLGWDDSTHRYRARRVEPHDVANAVERSGGETHPVQVSLADSVYVMDWMFSDADCRKRSWWTRTGIFAEKRWWPGANNAVYDLISFRWQARAECLHQELQRPDCATTV